MLAALTQRFRQPYTLYLTDRPEGPQGGHAGRSNHERERSAVAAIEAAAASVGVPVERLSRQDMNVLCKDRPHQVIHLSNTVLSVCLYCLYCLLF